MLYKWRPASNMVMGVGLLAIGVPALALGVIILVAEYGQYFNTDSKAVERLGDVRDLASINTNFNRAFLIIVILCVGVGATFLGGNLLREKESSWLS
jgi:hypothetical protein